MVIDLGSAVPVVASALAFIILVSIGISGFKGNSKQHKGNGGSGGGSTNSGDGTSNS